MQLFPRGIKTNVEEIRLLESFVLTPQCLMNEFNLIKDPIASQKKMLKNYLVWKPIKHLLYLEKRYKEL